MTPISQPKAAFVLVLAAVLFFAACEQKMSEEEVKQFALAHAEWQADRIKKLKSPDGFLNLAGLYPLQRGVNTFGSDSTNSIVFPAKAPARIGKLMATTTNSVLFEPAAGTEVLLRPVAKDSSWAAGEMQLVYDDSLHIQTQMQTGDLAWFIIRRGNELWVRLRDYKHPALDSLQSIEAYPVDINWLLTAEFEPYDPPKILKIQNIMGNFYEQPSPGRLVFEKDGQEFSLDVTEDGDEFFVTFADATTGDDTYGGGRYVYTSKPDSNGKVVLDFNKAYNPPCVYTAYATCPLPPPQNKMPVAVLAGEKFSSH